MNIKKSVIIVFFNFISNYQKITPKTKIDAVMTNLKKHKSLESECIFSKTAHD